MSDEIKNMWDNAASGENAGWYTPDNPDRRKENPWAALPQYLCFCSQK